MIAGLLAADVAFAFQQTAVVPAIHSVEQSLGASREWSAWLITVYLIVATIATPAMGRLADLHGRRRLLLIGLGVFTAGSVGAAFAPDTAFLLACRAIQGVGGSVYPLTLAMARGLFRPERAGRVIAWQRPRAARAGRPSRVCLSRRPPLTGTGSHQPTVSGPRRLKPNQCGSSRINRAPGGSTRPD